MPESSRIDDLRRRVQKDPASIAFAQLAEECRRAGQCQDAVDICRAGLAIHPGYLSARVTLGRALLETNELEDAQLEFQLVLSSASENIAAIRGLAEAHHRLGNLPEALAQYRAALLLARNDPDLERTVEDLTRQVEPVQARPSIADGLSLAEMQSELLERAPLPPPAVTPVTSEIAPSIPLTAEPDPVEDVQSIPLTVSPEPRDDDQSMPFVISREPPEGGHRLRARLTVVALEQYLAAVHVARAE